jgi:protein phosphatase
MTGMMKESLRYESSLISEQGPVRERNEDYADSFTPETPEELQRSGSLYVVADGVGGEREGEKASRYAVQTLLHEYYLFPDADPDVRMQRAMQKANQEIHAYAEKQGIRMATTAVAAAIRENQLWLANVGDSRAYLIRGGKAQLLTHDHTVVGELVRHGILTEDEAERSNAKNRLSRSLGGEPEVQVERYDPIPLQPGDRLLLCTDGLTRYTTNEDLARMVSKGNPEEVASRLTSFALKSGGVDNITLIVVAVTRGMEPAGVPAGAAPTVRRAPPPVNDLDILDTQPPAATRRLSSTQRSSAAATVRLPASEGEPLRVGGLKLPPAYRRYAPYAVAALLVLCVVGIGGALFGSQLFTRPTQDSMSQTVAAGYLASSTALIQHGQTQAAATQTEAAAQTQVAQAALETQSTQATHTALATQTAIAQLTAQALTAAAQTFQVIPTAQPSTATEPVLPVQTESPPAPLQTGTLGERICVVKVEKGDSLSKIFNVPWETKKHQYFRGGPGNLPSCSRSDSFHGTQCIGNPFDIPDNGVLTPGWFILIPNVDSYTCLNTYKGIWAYWNSQ